MSLTRDQRGFGAIAAIVVLVILALLAAAIVSISTTQQLTSAQDVMSAKAWQAARAGNEWGLFQALQNSSCVANTPLDLSAQTGFHVTVSCSSSSFREGESAANTSRSLTVYQITAVACPAAPCPADDASVAGPGYVERRRVVLATDE